MNEPVAKASIDAGYETTDVNVSGLWKVGLGVIISAVVIQGLVAWFYWLMADASSAEQKPINARAARERVYGSEGLERLPAPRLQKSETADIDELRAKEAAKLRHIDEAMKLLADPKTAAKAGVVSRMGGK